MRTAPDHLAPGEQRVLAVPRRNRTAVELVNDPVVPGRGAANAGGDSRAKDRVAAPATDRMTRARDAEAEFPDQGSLNEHYEEFCRAKLAPDGGAVEFHRTNPSLRNGPKTVEWDGARS
jgi:hypothetical protein